MVKEFFKDCKYIAEVASQGFQLMVTIKITIIPIIVAILSYVVSRLWPFLALPSWIWLPVTIFTILFCLLFIIARHARELETPNIKILFKPDNSDFIIPTNIPANQGGHESIEVRILPITEKMCAVMLS